MKALFYLPVLALSNLRLLLPRKLFIATYTPSTDTVRASELQICNASRLAAYRAKKLIGM